MNHKLLVVDDEPVNLRLVERLFRRTYDVVTANSGKEGLEVLGQHDIALIISDQRMPEMTGIEFLKHAAETRRHTVRIILTGYTDIGALVEAINSGVVYKYVSKPWLNEDLIQTVKRGLEVYESNKQVHSLMLNNQRLLRGIGSAQNAFVRLVATALEAHDPKTLEHARRTSGYAIAIAERMMCLDENDIEKLSLAAQLHGIGRIGLACNAKLGDEHLSEEMRHANLETTENILSEMPEMGEIAVAVKHHREHYDGSGHPEGLNGQRIPLFSRIIAVASAYAELIGGSSMPHEEAVSKLISESGKKFDPTILKVLEEIGVGSNASAQLVEV